LTEIEDPPTIGIKDIVSGAYRVITAAGRGAVVLRDPRPAGFALAITERKST
jgi:hypothetical protein